MEATHPQVIVLGRSEAAALLEGPGAIDIGAIISIHSRSVPPIESSNVPRRLVLQFDDTQTLTGEDPVADYLVGMRRRRGEVSRVRVPPTIEHAQAIIDFAGNIDRIERSLLCQCLGGVSRSAGAALLCLAVWTGPGEEAYCFDYLRSIRPFALPHRGLVVFGDKLLERDGGLVDMLDAMRRH